MRIRIVAVGKVKEKFLSDGIAEYVKRIGRWADVSIVEIDDYKVKENGAASAAIAMDKEATAIESHLKGTVFALDIDGKNLSSPALADAVKQAFEKDPVLTFVIGGSYGLADRLKQRADLRLSFGRNTYPHQLMRLMLCEQAYRALTIVNNHPYHK